MNETPKPDTTESPYPDTEDWEIAFKPYAVHPDAALNWRVSLWPSKNFYKAIRPMCRKPSRH